MFGIVSRCVAIGTILASSFGARSAPEVGWHYEYDEGRSEYHAVEAGRIIRLLEIRLRDTTDPFEPLPTILVEPCAVPAHGETCGPIPCWPADRAERTQELLATLIGSSPDYRHVERVLKAAGYLNRDLGAFHPAWVIGTDPLVVALRSGTGDPHPYKDLKLYHGSTTRPTTTPGLIEIVSRSGGIRLYDLRCRHAKLVSQDDLRVEADVVMVFPQQIHLPGGQSMSETTTQAAPQLKLFFLHEAAALDTIMKRLTEAGALERSAKKVEEVPVKPT